MDALQEILERESAFDRNNDLTIQDEVFLAQRQRGSNKLRKIATEILTRPRIHGRGVSTPRQQATEPVPFRFVLPFLADRDGVDRSRFHGLDIIATRGWMEGDQTGSK